MEINDFIEITIDDLAFGGEGVGRLNDFVFFIPFTIPGERVRAQITELKAKFGRAKRIDLLLASPERVEPRCGYFEECGGCQYQHIDYPRQVEYKQHQIQSLMQRLAHLDPSRVAPTIPCPQSYGYRNRIMVRTQWNKPKKALDFGFLRHDNRWVLDIERCEIAEEALNEALTQHRRNPPPRGGLKVVIRHFPENWELPNDSFFQNNFFLLPELVRTVREGFQSSGNSFLVDVYCGVGFFGIELSDLAQAFIGVELDKRAIQAARTNCENRNITNGTFLYGAAEDLMPELLNKFPPDKTTFVLDPPRKGCPRPSLELLREARPNQILYVSCHPATLARDLNILTETGLYEVRRITPLDMFPQTQHVECVADVRLVHPVSEQTEHP